MVAEAQFQAALALHRFGVGPRGDIVERIARDPRGALIAELERPGGAGIINNELLTSEAAARAVFEFQQERKAMRLARAAQPAPQPAAAKNAGPDKGMVPPAEAAAQAAETNSRMAPQPGSQGAPGAVAANAQPQPAAQSPGPGVPQQIFLQEAKVRFEAACNAEIGLVERLVWFWSDHFCVSADKGGVRPLAGAFEREAIRPYVLGRFADMLAAVESHPAMLLYLDNARSIGPHSQAGLRSHKGLNENLAREIMELHTLGVRSGYTQDDVTAFAKVITGWTVRPARLEQGGVFEFNPRMHEPGAQTVLGRSYPDGGVGQGRAVLADLAGHPATAEHIATKLARHFVADEPPHELIASLADAFRRSSGDLMAVTRALIVSPQAWTGTRSKLKRPGEWITAAWRVTGLPASDPRPLINMRNLLGEPLGRPPAPKGFDDVEAAWMDGLAQRLDIANQLSRRAATADPKALIETALGPLASAETRQAVARAESRPQAVALLLMAPEFQRR